MLILPICSCMLSMFFSSTLWWLILCQFDWATGSPDIWSSIVLDVSMRLLLNEINIWMSRQSKANCTSKCEWVSSTHDLNKTKRLRWGTTPSWLQTLRHYSFPDFMLRMKNWIFLSLEPTGFWKELTLSALLILKHLDLC